MGFFLIERLSKVNIKKTTGNWIHLRYDTLLLTVKEQDGLTHSLTTRTDWDRTVVLLRHSSSRIKYDARNILVFLVWDVHPRNYIVNYKCSVWKLTDSRVHTTTIATIMESKVTGITIRGMWWMIQHQQPIKIHLHQQDVTLGTHITHSSYVEEDVVERLLIQVYKNPAW